MNTIATYFEKILCADRASGIKILEMAQPNLLLYYKPPKRWLESEKKGHLM